MSSSSAFNWAGSPSALVDGRSPLSFSFHFDRSSSSFFLPSNPTLSASLVTLFVLVASLLGFQFAFGAPSGLRAPKGSKARTLHSFIPALGQVGFYGKSRSSWIDRHMADYQHGDALEPIRMNVRDKIVTVVSGPKSAKSFFNNRDLNFRKAYAALFAGIKVPERKGNDLMEADVDERTVSLDQPAPKEEALYIQWGNKHLRACLSNQRLTQHKVMQKIALDFWQGFQDIWTIDKDPRKGQSGLIDMQSQLYAILLRVSVRVVGSTEIADSKELIEPIMRHYWDMETLNSFANVLLPNLPIPSNKRRKRAGEELFQLLHAPIQKRIETGVQEEDYVQMLIETGTSSMDITLWVTGFLFASIINSSSVFAWTLAMTSANPTIYAKLRKEIDETVERLSKENGLQTHSASVLDRISSLSIEQLEDNFHYTYFCVREVIRIVTNDMLLRRMEPRKAGSTGTVGGEQIRDGEYLAFMAGTVNMNADIYTEPTRYDPDRWERNEGSGPYDFLGWGTGLHPCIGMKLAKNELKMGLAMFLSLMDVQPVDGQGVNVYTAHTLPTPIPFQGGYRSPSAPLLLKYTMRV